MANSPLITTLLGSGKGRGVAFPPLVTDPHLFE